MTETSRKRPWLAVLLGVVVSGLGHAYLRRWGRAFGWYVLITATVVFFVPESAIEGVLAGDPPPITQLLPPLALAVASVVDAYVLAVRHNEANRRDATGLDADDPASVTADDATTDPPEEAVPMTECPHCGREVDAELDFCHWCTEELPGRGASGDD